MRTGGMRVIRCDGSPTAVGELDLVLRAALSGGAALAPLGPGQAPPARDPGPGHVVLSTSGSTRGPKRVLLHVGALRASATATHARLGGPGRWLLALPAHHVAGLQVLVRAALAGTQPVLLDLRGGFDAAGFGVAARELTGSRRRPGQPCYTALVPTQLVRLLDSDPGALTGFDAVLLGGAAAPEGLVRRAWAAGSAVVTTYGMTETAGGCVYDGWPLDGVRVRLSPAAEPTGPASTAPASTSTGPGRIEIAGPMLASGYLEDPGQTTTAFRDGWFLTSDVGSLDDDGRLRVLGRADDVIVTGGINVVPAAVEAVLTGLPGVRAACVVGLPDPEWGELVAAAVVPTDPARPPDPDALRAAARCLLTGAQTPKKIVLIGALPLLDVGKPDRRGVRARLAGAPGNGAPDRLR